jgi:hypothetical protein
MRSTPSRNASNRIDLGAEFVLRSRVGAAAF